MTAAIFGLVGVVVGAFINGAANVYFERRSERSNRRSAARLVRSELVRFRSLAREADLRPPEELPQLRDIRPVVWESQRSVLARSLTDEDWALVALAYAHVDAVVSVLVFELDGTLIGWRSREAKRLFALMVEPVEKAALALRNATGVPADESGYGPDPAEDTIPVAR